MNENTNVLFPVKGQKNELLFFDFENQKKYKLINNGSFMELVETDNIDFVAKAQEEIIDIPELSELTKIMKLHDELKKKDFNKEFQRDVKNE